MSQRQFLKDAIAEVKSGQDRAQVFEKYRAQIRKPAHLAMSIASVPHPERKAQYAGLNYVLVFLLVLAALSKVAMGLWYFAKFSIFLGVGAVVLGVLVPLVFAIGIVRFDGRLYGLLLVVCAMNIVNLLIRFEQLGMYIFVDIAFLLVIIVVTILAKHKIFPNIGIFGPKKDPAGNFLL